MEYNLGDRPVPYMPEFLECRNGKVWPNDRPGLGVSVDEKALTFIEAMTEAAAGPTHRRPDGSLTTGRFTTEVLLAARRCDGDSARSIVLAGGGVSSLAAWAAASRRVPAASAQAAAQPDTRPNVVVVLVDDMGWSDIGPFGSEIATPESRRARRGAACASPSSMPRRAARRRAPACSPGCIRTRRAWGISTTSSAAGRSAPPDASTISPSRWPKCFATRATSRRCRASGTLARTTARPPWDRGFERTLSLRAGGMYFPNQNYTGGDNPLTSRAQEPLFLNGAATPRDAPVFGTNWYATYLWTEFGLKFIDEARQANKPFFLYLPFNAPHFPLMAPAELIAKYRGKYKAGWDRMRQERYQRQVRMGLIDAKWPLSPREAGHARLGLALRSTEGSVRPPDGGVCRDDRGDRHGRRHAREGPRGARRARQHAHRLHVGQRRQRRVRPGRPLQRRSAGRSRTRTSISA